MSQAKEFLYKGVAGKAALWQQKVDNPVAFKKKKYGRIPKQESEEAQSEETPSDSSNSNLEWDGTCYRQKLSSKFGDDYGKPPPGSKTEVRGKRAGVLISTEVIQVCFNILRIGYRNPDGTYIINFGSLFEMYTKISNKLVGMLLRARRQGLVEFKGEMLFQGRDDNVIIKIVKVPTLLEEYYNEIDGPVPEAMKMPSQGDTA